MKKADVCFIKAVQKKYANDFYNNGLIYLNTLENYRDLEDKDTAVGDKMENIIFSFSQGSIYYSPDVINNLSEVDNPVELIKQENKRMPVINFTGIDKSNNPIAHCLYISKYIIHYKNDKLEKVVVYIDPKFLTEFRNCSFFLIYKTQEYLDRIVNQLRLLQIDDIYAGKIEYFNESEDIMGTMGNPFLKRGKYSYQKEFRILAYNNMPEPLSIEIGNLNKICTEIFPL